MDLVVTVPKAQWADWLAEGDCAGDPPTGQEWAFCIGEPQPPIGPGERLYVAAWGRLRGYAPVTRVVHTDRGWCVWRAGGAVAVTIESPVEGFRGWRLVWWSPKDERPFPSWQTDGVPAAVASEPAPVPVYTDAVHLFLDANAWVKPTDDGKLTGRTVLLAPLHAFARKIGLRRSWLHATDPQFPHYDLTTPAAATRAVAAGAILVDMRDTARLSQPTGAPLRPANWRPTLLDPAMTAERNVALLRIFAGGRAIGVRGVAHLAPRADGPGDAPQGQRE